MSTLAEDIEIPTHPTALTESQEVIEPVSEDGRLVSEDDYWNYYYLESDIHYEWNNGRLEEKPVSDYQTYQVYAWFSELLRHFLRTRPIARMVALEMGFRLVLPHKKAIRKPDLGVVRLDNPQPLLPLDCSYHGVYDLCIEALSDKKKRDILRDTLTKRDEYAAAGVPEYYILHHQETHQGFFTRTLQGDYIPIAPIEGVIRSRVLPGFQFRVADLGQQPELETLRDDSVYRGFVLSAWRADRERADTEAQRADTEAQRADMETQGREIAEQRAAAEATARKAAEAELTRLRALLAAKDL